MTDQIDLEGTMRAGAPNALGTGTILVCSLPGVEPGPLPEALAKACPDQAQPSDQPPSAEAPAAVVHVDAHELGAALAAAGGTARVLLLLGDAPAAIARHSHETGCSPALAAARYERALRLALGAGAGHRVVVSDDAPPASPDPSASTWLPPELTALVRRSRRLVGTHDALVAEDLGGESPWTTELLGLEEELTTVGRALVWSAERLADLEQTDPGEAPEEDDGNQFREPVEGGPYRLNASEDTAAYHRWLTWKREPAVLGGPEPERRRARTRPRRRRPLISVVVPVFRPPLWALERCVGSVLAQGFADWELVLCDDASGDAELDAYLASLRRLDRRIRVTALERNGGISAATNRAIEIARGEFLAFLDHDDELAPRALAAMAEAIAANPDADYCYSDEDKIDASGERFDPLFKPEWSPDLLLSFAYTCHLSVVRAALVRELGGLRSAYDGSQDYDLTLRVAERARRVVHVPEVLYHWRTLPGSAASDAGGKQAKPWAYEAGRRAIADALERRGEPGEVTMLEGFPGRYHVRRRIPGRPKVSVIIPFRDEPTLLATCARTLREAPGYDHLELVLVDNDSQLPETKALLSELAADPDVRVVAAPGPFNWAAINNAAARTCRSELLLFLNNDIEARTPGWLDALVGHAVRRDVGAVGARLLYPDGSIQHAGVVIGLGGIAGHVLRGLPGDVPGYNSMAIQTRECSVVTGAAMMVRRAVFEEVGGFDEDLAVAFNDVDFCLKLRERGYRVVYTPLAELVHHESKSRGHTDDFAESRHMMDRWADAIVAGDPYLNVHLSHWRYWCPLSTAQEDDRWRNYLETRVLTRGSPSRP